MQEILTTKEKLENKTQAIFLIIRNKYKIINNLNNIVKCLNFCYGAPSSAQRAMTLIMVYNGHDCGTEYWDYYVKK